MEVKAERTLVKSPPELWEVIDDSDLIVRVGHTLLPAIEGPPTSRLAVALFRREEPSDVSIAVEERDPGRRLAWRISQGRLSARVAVFLAEKGWGTNVSIAVSSNGSREAGVARVLEDLLDELGSPQRRPFVRA